MDHATLVDATRTEGAAIVAALESEPAMDTPVPTCEHWAVSDLVVHLGAFCGFWTHILCEGTGRPRTPYPDPPEGDALIPWLAQLGLHLVGELEATPATTEVWTWFAADRTAAFVARRCAHELAVHRYDLQSTQGTRAPIPTALAVDGIDEILGALVTTRDRTGQGTGRALSLRCTDAPPAWSVVMESNRIDVERTDAGDGAPAGDLTVTGRASDLELTLYHRPTLGPVDVSGDYSVLDEWHREFRF
ncbi:MAG: maleylpyruvate isomerase N-terminal domain-containing protein [Acidimicrobiales bacterium]